MLGAGQDLGELCPPGLSLKLPLGRRPRPLSKVNKLRRRPEAQMGVAKSDLSQMRQSRSDLIMNAATKDVYTSYDIHRQ